MTEADWAAREADLLRQLTCKLCGGPHTFDTTVPSAQWNEVIRASGLPEFLCASCILKAFALRGESFTAELWSDQLNGIPIDVRIADRDATTSAKVSAENTTLRSDVSRLTADVERLTAERDRALAERDKWVDNFNRSEQFQSGSTTRAEAAEATLTRLREGGYVQHAIGCSYGSPTSVKNAHPYGFNLSCSCGLADILAGLPATSIQDRR